MPFVAFYQFISFCVNAADLLIHCVNDGTRKEERSVEEHRSMREQESVLVEPN